MLPACVGGLYTKVGVGGQVLRDDRDKPCHYSVRKGLINFYDRNCRGAPCGLPANRAVRFYRCLIGKDVLPVTGDRWSPLRLGFIFNMMTGLALVMAFSSAFFFLEIIFQKIF